MRKTQASQQDSKPESSEPESSELPKILTPKESESAAVQNSHDDGDRYSEDEEIASDGKLLTRAVLMMSNELRNQNKRVFDIEQCLYDWMKTLEGLVQHCDSLVKQTKSRTYRETESRGTQCDLIVDDTPVEEKMSKAEVTKSLPTQCQDGDKSAGQRSSHQSDDRKSDQASRRHKSSGNDVNASTAVPNKSKDTGTKPSTNEREKKSCAPKTDDVSASKDKSSENESKERSKNTLILSDSVLNGVNAERLGVSFGFSCDIKSCYTIDKIECTFKDQVKDGKVPEVTVLHCGINDLKNTSPQNASANFIKATKSIKKMNPKMKIVVSAVAPVTRKDLEVKRLAFNAINKAELLNESNVSIISHDNLDAQSWKFMQRDGIHPTRDGSSLLAVNLGRHLRNAFWTHVKSRRRSSPQNYRSIGHSNHSHVNPPFQIPLRNRFAPFNHGRVSHFYECP